MSSQRIPKIPGPDHPITVEPTPGHVIVRLGGRTIADSHKAFTLRESDYPAVQYVPRSDVDMSLLERTSHSTYCPYKGEASYYTISVGDNSAKNAVWTYETPYSAVAEIKDHLAFYADRVEAIEISEVN